LQIRSLRSRPALGEEFVRQSVNGRPINRGEDAPRQGGSRVIYHAVLFKMKPNVSQAKIDEIFRELGRLQTLIPGLLSFSGGPYSSPEGLNKGYTHGFLMTFADAEARNAYLPHPEHERVKAIVVPNLDDVVAFDWEG
jgi:hypothetical protein